MIEVEHLTKRYGDVVAVDDISFAVAPGRITGFLMAHVVIGGSLVGQAIPTSSQRYLPFSALQATVTVNRTDELLSPLAALRFIVGYAVISVAGAMYVIRRRDI